MDSELGDLAFLPLGGTGEIGMNLNLYRCDGKWLAVDCGIGFGGAAHPEVDVMMADPGFIADRRDNWSGWSSPMRTRTISAPSPGCGRS